MKIYWVD